MCDGCSTSIVHTRLCLVCKEWRTPAPHVNVWKEFVCWECNPYSYWALTHIDYILEHHPEWNPPDLEVLLKPVGEQP